VKLRIGILCLVAIASGAVLFAVTRDREPKPSRGAPGDEQPEPTPPAATSNAPGPGAATSRADIRRQINEAVERSARSTNRDNLPQFLQGLLDRARAQGKITALESEVGMDVIQRAGGDIETQIAYTQKLNDLARELSGESKRPQPTPAQARAQVSALGTRLDQGTFADENEREALIREFTEKAHTLGAEGEIEAMQRLNAIVARRQPQAAAPPTDLASQWSAVEHAQGAERQAAIKRLIEAIDRLPPSEQIDQQQRLNELAR
jgi:hypothetical protein